ncbi:MAG: pilus motility taxis protein HmpF, partial [Cyanobacteria bacterium P01_A01_bin.83]
MLYLAEIQKHNKSFLGGVETKLKLIACQRNDQSWSLVTNESITTEEANDFGDGALVVLNLGVNRQLQGKIELASQKIIGVLKNFSRLLEKNQEQEQEINQWKESLAIQSEELSRRQIEMETRLEQVEQMEEEFKQFEQQRSEIELAKAETEKIRAEFEAKSAELEGAWSQLRGQQQNIDEQLKQAQVLDEAQVAEIKQQLSTLCNSIDVANSLKEQLNAAEHAAKEQQQTLQTYWDNLQQNSQDIIVKRQELENITKEISQKKTQIDALHNSIVETQQQLVIERRSLDVKQELTQFLNLQSESQDKMLEILAGSELEVDGVSKTDINELENMPLPSLESTVETLKKDLEKVARFVSDQEEELDWQCKAVEELEAKIAKVNDFERLTLEQELADEKEAKKMLDQTLVGQRRSLKERHQVLLEHSRVLKRRQGIVDFDFESEIQDIDLTPIKEGLEQQQQKLIDQRQELAEEVAQIESSIQALEAKLQEQQTHKSQFESQINQQQDNWQNLNLGVVQIQSQIDFYQEQLQPIQDNLDTINHQISEMRQSMLAHDENNPSDA